MPSSDRLKTAIELYQLGEPSMPGNSHYTECLSLLNTLLEEDPKLKRAYNLRWHIHYLRKRPELALSDMNNAVALDPENKIFRYNRGVILQHMGKFIEALTDFEKITNPTSADPEDDDLFDAAEHHVFELKNKLSKD